MVSLNKENLRNLLGELKERYGDIKISSMINKIWNDNDFKDMTIYQKLLYGKRVRINLKSGGISSNFKLGKRL